MSHLVVMEFAMMESVIALLVNGMEKSVTSVSSLNRSKRLEGTYNLIVLYPYPATCNPGCEHGDCIAPNHCKCNYGWEGRSCNLRELIITTTGFLNI